MKRFRVSPWCTITWDIASNIPNAVVLQLRIAMDLFQHRYYRINKILMSIVGLWPHQSACARRGVHIFFVRFIAASYIIPQIIAFVQYHGDWEFLLQSCISYVFMAGLIAKFTCSRMNSHKISKLLNRIRMDWKVWARDGGVNVLHEYAAHGRKMTLVYTVMLYTTGILFVILPVTPKLVDTLLKNGSKPGQFPCAVDYYYIDEQKYYFYIIAHSMVSITVGFLVSIANDTMFIVYVQHGCGIFSALGRKLKCIGADERIAKTGKTAYFFDKKDTVFEHLVWCIKRHNDAIEFAGLIESTYTWSFFFIVGCNMLIISITGFQIVRGISDSHETTKFIICNMAAMVHLYIESYMSQSLIDHSISIRYYVHNAKWYKLSLRAQKTLYVMLIRCNVACKLTAGKMSVMSIENFTVILRTSMSCLTVLRTV